MISQIKGKYGWVRPYLFPVAQLAMVVAFLLFMMGAELYMLIGVLIGFSIVGNFYGLMQYRRSKPGSENGG